MIFRRYRRVGMGLILAGLVLVAPVQAQLITTAPRSQAVAIGGSAAFSVTAAGTALTYQWKYNGVDIPGATAAGLTLTNVQPANAGLYTVTITSGANASTSDPAILGVTTTSKLVGPGTEFPDIVHPVTGFTYDQILLQGPAASVTADPGQILRISYIDLSDDIVQVEFSGAGTLTLVLETPTGPAVPVNYNQTVQYMKGHARIIIAGAAENTNLSVFSVGTLINPNPALYKSGVTYDGLANLASVAILSTDGRFAGLRSANGSYFATRGITGVYAPGVQFGGPVFVEDINAFDTATPMLYLGSAADTRVTGGDFLQTNSQAVRLAGITQLSFVNGTTAHGAPLPAQAVGGQLLQDGVDVTAQIAGLRPASALYLAVLRPESAAPDSLASGFATLQVNANGSASVAVSFSNLSSAQTGAHLRIGPSGDFVFNLGLGQVTGKTWTYAATGLYRTPALIEALNTGNIYVGLDTARYPAGELRGQLVTATGSQVFVPPVAPPALPANALAAPTQTDAARLLTQATFGPTTDTIDNVMARGINGWIDDQMALPMTSALGALRTLIAVMPQPVNPPPGNAVLRAATATEWHAAWWKISVTAPDQLRQRVAFALSELLVVGEDGSDASYYGDIKAKYYDTLLAGAFGNYRDLLETVSRSVSMGNWLTYLWNLKADPAKGTAPDENYAREVQQLFTVGLVQLQPDGTLLLDPSGQPIPTYDQATITETAKLFTGWAYGRSDFTSDTLTNLSQFLRRPAGPAARTPIADGEYWLQPMQNYTAFHDSGQKRVISLEQVPLAEAHPTVIPAGQTGLRDLQQFLDTLCAHPNIGPFVVKHLIQRLVTANPSPGYVYRVAKVWADDGTGARGNLGAVVRAILTDYEARSPDVVDRPGYGKLKEPLIRTTALFRALNVAAPNGQFLDTFYSPGSGFSSLIYPSAFGQAPLNAKTVFNFFSPTYSLPGAMAAAGLVSPEMEITDSTYSIVMPRILQAYIYRDPATLPQPASGASPYVVPDFSAFLAKADNATALIDLLNLVFCANQMSAATKATLASHLRDVTALPNTTALDRVRSAINLAVDFPDGVIQR